MSFYAAFRAWSRRYSAADACFTLLFDVPGFLHISDGIESPNVDVLRRSGLCAARHGAIGRNQIAGLTKTFVFLYQNIPPGIFEADLHAECTGLLLSFWDLQGTSSTKFMRDFLTRSAWGEQVCGRLTGLLDTENAKMIKLTSELLSMS